MLYGAEQKLVTKLVPAIKISLEFTLYRLYTSKFYSK